MRFYKVLPLTVWRLSSFVLLVLVCLLSACTDSNTVQMIQPTPQKTAQASTAIQLYDSHGTLICQIHASDPQRDCLKSTTGQNQFASHFINYALNELAIDMHVTIATLPVFGLNVSTTLDLDLQKHVLQNTQQYIGKMAKTHNMSNAAVVILDYHTGAIRSLFGSIDQMSNATGEPFDVATQSVRQLGSVFKPFVYATAFEQGMSPGNVVYDGPIAVGSPPYSPRNYDMKYHGYVSYRTALQNSFNIPAVKLLVKIGNDSLLKKVRDLGIQLGGGPQTYGYSLALGTPEASLLDTTVAYGSMANGGIHIPPHAIDKITAADGHIIYQAQPQSTHALSPETAFMMTSVLSDNKARTPEFGACSPLLLYTTTMNQCLAGNTGTVRPAAVKTGLTETFRDTWTVGYTSDMVVGAWAGNSDVSPMANITGLDGASQIWHDTMLLAEAGYPVKQFPGPPADVVNKTVSYPGLTTSDWYVTGK